MNGAYVNAVASITDPDGSVERFGYTNWGRDYAMFVYTDRRGTGSWYDWDDYGHTVHHGHTWLNGVVISPAFSNTGDRGAAPWIGSLDRTQADYTYTGPRTDLTATTSFWTDGLGAVTRSTDATGNATTVEHGDPRFPLLATRVVQPNGFETRASYDARGRLMASTQINPYADGRDATTTYAWDAKWDAITQVTSPEGVVTATGIDPATGLRMWQQDGRGLSTRTAFLYNGEKLLRAIQPPGAQCDTTTNAAGCQYLVYDSLGNVADVRDEVGGEITYSRNSMGQPWQVRTMVSRQSFFNTIWQTETGSLDIMGRDTLHIASGSAVNGAPAQTVYVRKRFDSGGLDTMVERWTLPDTAHVGHIATHYQRDALGRVIHELAPDLAADTTVYDAAGNVVRHIDRNGRGMRFTFDPLDRMVSRRTDALSIGPEIIGMAAWLSQPDDGSGQFLIDAGFAQPYPWGHPTGYVIPAVLDTFTYHPVSGAMTDAVNPYATVHRDYFANGQVKTETDTVRQWGGGTGTHSYVTERRYDLDGRRRSLAYPSVISPSGTGTALTDYDAYGFLSSITDLQGGVTQYHWDARGQLAWRQFPMGAIEGYTYRQDGSLLTDTIRADGLLRRDSLAYDRRGKMTMLRSFPRQRVEWMYYDGLGQLVADSTRLDNGQFATSSRYVLDGLGNDVMHIGSDVGIRLEDAATIRASDAKSEFKRYVTGTGRLWLSSPNVADYYAAGAPATSSAFVNRYDPAGNLEWSARWQYAQGSHGHPDDSQTDRKMYYGPDGKLWAVDARHADKPANSGAMVTAYDRSFEEYRYDALGRRVLTRMDQSCNDFGTTQDVRGECRVNGVRRTVWDGTQEIGEIQVNEAAPENDLAIGQADTTTGQNLSQYYGAVAYTFDGAVDQPLAVTRLRYANLSQNGLVSYPTFTLYPTWNAHGAIDGILHGVLTPGTCTGELPLQRINCIQLETQPGWLPYQLYTSSAKSWNGTLLQAKRGAGGLAYRRNRYYDPMTGKFTQEDPIGLAGGLNVYGYANGDPVSYSDPFGLMGCKWDDVACWEDQMLAASGGTGVSGRVLAPLASTLLELSGASSVDAHAKAAAGGSRAGMALLALDIAASVVPGAGELEAASGRLLGEAAAGEGTRLIAGAGHAKGKAIDDIGRLVETYGGKAADWAKMSGRSFTSSAGKKIEVHWYENVATGARYEFKTKLVKGW